MNLPVGLRLEDRGYLERDPRNDPQLPAGPEAEAELRMLNSVGRARGFAPYQDLHEWHEQICANHARLNRRRPWRLTPAGDRALGDQLTPRLSSARGIRELVEMATTGRSLAEVRGTDGGRRAA